jgi:hypothetical protein
MYRKRKRRVFHPLVNKRERIITREKKEMRDGIFIILSFSHSIGRLFFSLLLSLFLDRIKIKRRSH